MANKNKPTYSAPVRLLALILTGLVASGVLVYLLTFLLNLFGVGGTGHVH